MPGADDQVVFRVFYLQPARRRHDQVLGMRNRGSRQLRLAQRLPLWLRDASGELASPAAHVQPSCLLNSFPRSMSLLGEALEARREHDDLPRLQRRARPVRCLRAPQPGHEAHLRALRRESHWRGARPRSADINRRKLTRALLPRR